MRSPHDTANTALLNFILQQQAICAQYPDAYIILYDTEIVGPFTTMLEAYREAFTRFEIGTFIVKYCGDIKDDNAQ